MVISLSAGFETVTVTCIQSFDYSLLFSKNQQWNLKAHRQGRI